MVSRIVSNVVVFFIVLWVWEVMSWKLLYYYIKGYSLKESLEMI